MEQQIPLDNGIPVLNVGGDEKGSKKITSLSLKSVNSNVTTIEPHFLHRCRNLTTLDLSGLTNIRYIEKYFLCLCLNLTSLTLPNISPRLITVEYNYFLADVPSSTVFHCGQYVEEYKNTFP